jgi:hypothetical protein
MPVVVQNNSEDTRIDSSDLRREIAPPSFQEGSGDYPALRRTPDDAATQAIGRRLTNAGVAELTAYGADDGG